MIAPVKKVKTILIVDDTPENVSLLEAILSAEYATLTASRGSEAIEIARTTPPDLILLDIMMPVMNGYEVCKILKGDEVTRRIPVIFVTALLDPGDEALGFEAGGEDYITKPVFGAVVRARVRAHLALKEVQDELEEWNGNLKKRLLQSVSIIRNKTEKLMSVEEKNTGLKGYVQSLELLSGVFEMMEGRFCIHSHAVSELAGDAARKMNLSAEEVTKIRLAGLLHDVGTVGTRHGLPKMPEADMTLDQREEFHAHPVRSQGLFKTLAEFADIGLMVRGHHEAFDGSGFPDGLKDDAIPLGARLLAIANFIEQSATSVAIEQSEYALTKARLQGGTLLDPRLITYFSMITRIMYFDGKKPGRTSEINATTGEPITEAQINPCELISGMQLSRNLTNDAGVLLLQAGKTLDSAGIALICRISQTKKPSESGVWICVGDEQ
jgi:putative two-component system response regulator